MLLAIDIGNTTVSWAVMKGRRIVQVRFLENSALRSALKNELLRAQKHFPQLNQVLLCSVVPEHLKIVQRAVQRHLKVKPLIIGKDIKVPIKNNYYNPKQVGQDRLVCSFAAKCLYGQPAIIVDFGTAITFDLISKRGDYEGGIIVPGIRLSIESLHKKTALLPDIRFIKGPRALIGKNTKESILSGIFFGYGAMCCGLIESISKHINGKPKVIVTGGHTHLMKKFISKKISIIDEHLVFKGMELLSRHSKER